MRRNVLITALLASSFSLTGCYVEVTDNPGSWHIPTDHTGPVDINPFNADELAAMTLRLNDIAALPADVAVNTDRYTDDRDGRTAVTALAQMMGTVHESLLHHSLPNTQECLDKHENDMHIAGYTDSGHSTEEGDLKITINNDYCSFGDFYHSGVMSGDISIDSEWEKTYGDLDYVEGSTSVTLDIDHDDRQVSLTDSDFQVTLGSSLRLNYDMTMQLDSDDYDDYLRITTIETVVISNGDIFPRSGHVRMTTKWDTLDIEMDTGGVLVHIDGSMDSYYHWSTLQNLAN